MIYATVGYSVGIYANIQLQELIHRADFGSLTLYECGINVEYMSQYLYTFTGGRMVNRLSDASAVFSLGTARRRRADWHFKLPVRVASGDKKTGSGRSEYGSWSRESSFLRSDDLNGME